MKSKANLKAGSVMDLATKEVITMPPTTTIMNALKLMLNHNFRRIPIADAGTNRIEGIISATDLVNFFGGGEKYRIVQERYNNNLPAAVNEEVEKIMEKNVITIEYTDSWEDALELMLEKGVGGCPVVDRENKVVGIITERDMLKFLAKRTELDGFAADYMTKGVLTAKPDVSIEEAMKLMISKKIRRLPIIDDGILIGLVTIREILRYFGKGEAFKMLVTGNIKDALNKPVSTILSNPELLVYKEPLTFNLDVKISKVVEAMLDKNYGVALILNDGRLEGIITEKDMMKFLYSKT